MIRAFTSELKVGGRWAWSNVVLTSCLGAEQHFPEVMLGEEFLSLSLDQVCSLISSDKLTVSSEEKVLCPSGKT